MNNTSSYQAINFEDRHILSKEATKSLLEQAIRMEKTGASEILSVSDIQTAKEFFPKWRKDRTGYKKIEPSIFLSLVFGYLLYSNFAGLYVNLLLVVGYVFFLYLYEDGGTKCRYISEMLGDISHIKKSKRLYFLGGLKFEIFKGKTLCVVDFVKLGIVLLVLSSLVVGSHFTMSLDIHNQLSVFGGILILVFNMINYIKE